MNLEGQGSEDYLIPGTEALDLHQLYRAMTFLGQEIEPNGQKTLFYCDYGLVAKTSVSHNQ